MTCKGKVKVLGNHLELLSILDYFEDTHLGAVRRGIRRAPRFPATRWSIYDRVTDELPRTNKAVADIRHSGPMQVVTTSTSGVS